MSLAPVRNLQLHNQIDRVLHVPGNYRGGILEMTIVVDRAYDRETVRTLCADIIESCKKQSNIFRNVRLNMVMWGKEEISTQTVAAAHIQIGTFFDKYEAETAKTAKSTEELMEYLKKFHARSKLILAVVQDKEQFCKVEDAERLKEAMNPFLKQKLVIVYPEEMESGTEYFIKIL
ncbi:MAG: hypothetical protein K2L82_12955 [Lachnospiraceae bacterium]|nr:hypothetical protein [Lachnospiraceae bacterium]